MGKNLNPLEKIANLLAIADHPNSNQHERNAALAQAERLMAKHEIDEAIARSNMTESEKTSPVVQVFSLPEDYEFRQHILSLLRAVATHHNCRTNTNYRGETVVVGYPQNVSWTMDIQARCYYALVGALNPGWDPDLSFDDNVYNLKVAGFEYKRINDIAVSNGYSDQTVYKNIALSSGGTSRVQRIRSTYKDAYRRVHTRKYLAGELEETEVGFVTSFKLDVYRRSLALAFVSRIEARLSEIRSSAFADTGDSAGTSLVLAQDMEAVNDLFYERFPEYDPVVQEHHRAKWEQENKERAAQEAKARKEMLEGMTPAKRVEFLDKERRATDREQERWSRQYHSSKNQRKYEVDYTARSRGANTADQVNLGHQDGIRGRSASVAIESE